MSVAGAAAGRSRLRAALRQPDFIVGSTLVFLITIACLLAPVIARHDPNFVDLHALESPPSAQHRLGTDSLGRDVLSRLLFGGRNSLLVASAAVVVQVAIGVVLGGIAGYAGGFWDGLIMRVTEVFQCIPFYALAITLAAIFGASVWNVVLIIGLLRWTGLARLVRAEILSLREQEFVLVARSLGLPGRHIVTAHLLRNCLPVIVVNGTLAVTTAILAEAALSFLGLGVAQPDPSWGNMLSAAQSMRVLSSEPWLWVPPGLAIVILVLAVNSIGESLSRALNPQGDHIVADIDPRLPARAEVTRDSSRSHVAAAPRSAHSSAHSIEGEEAP